MIDKGLLSVTVVIPAYNEESCIRQCLEALVQQDYPRELVEIIVVDDCSTDNTRAIAKEYGVTVIDNGRRDPEYGKMLGFKIAKGELFCNLDADFVIRGRDWLKRMIYPFIDDGSINSSVTCYYPHPNDTAINRYITFDPNQVDPIYSCFAPHMKETIRETRRDYSRYYDLDFLVLLVENGYNKFAYVPSAGIYHFHVASLAELCKKRLRNIRKCYLPRVHAIKYEWFSLAKKRDVVKIILWILYVHAIIPALFVGFRKCIRNRDIAGLYEPLVCLAVTDVILFGFLFSKRGLSFILRTLVLGGPFR